jgi:phosphate transport system protein
MTMESRMSQMHTDHEYEAELGRIREHVARMGQQVRAMLGESVHAFESRDVHLAQRVVASDREVDRLEVETDELCLRVLARRQPMGSDLRLVTTAMKLVTDVERIGDLCVNIGERAMELAQETAAESFEDISAMARAVGEMVRQAMEAFAAADPAAARSVIEADMAVDARYAQAFRQLLNRMMADRANVSWATRVQAVAKYLERIGDHATNLAEMVVFMVQGRDIRHAEGQQDREAGHGRGILFLCVHNAARSQMAEGWARNLLPAGVEVWSAGTDPATQVDPRAIEAMREAGVDISAQRPKRISDVPLGRVDTVVTLCAEELCFTLPGITRRETWVLPDPGNATGGTEEIMRAFREVRDGLKVRIEAMLPRS